MSKSLLVISRQAPWSGPSAREALDIVLAGGAFDLPIGLLFLDDGVFVGPGVILTNDRVPRAVTPDGDLKSAADWDPVGVRIGTGASIGAGSVCVAPISIGAWAM